MFISSALVASLLAIPAQAQFAVRVFVDGDLVTFDQPPIIQGSRVRVPLRFLSEALGATVDYRAADRTIFIFSGQAGGPIPPPAPVPVTGTIQGVITEVILPRCVTGQALMTVEAADGEHEIRITADTVITRFDVGSGLGGSVGVPRRT